MTDRQNLRIEQQIAIQPRSPVNHEDRSEASFTDFTVKGARRCAEQGRLEAWIQAYLSTGEDDFHQRLGAWFNRAERFWVGPVEMPLSRLIRRLGPEEAMPWKEPCEDWERRVTSIQRAVAHPGDMPPMIARAVRDEAGAFQLLLNDGAHRHEALKRLGETTFWVLIWFDSAALRRAFLAEL